MREDILKHPLQVVLILNFKNQIYLLQQLSYIHYRLQEREKNMKFVGVSPRAKKYAATILP